MVGLVPLNSWLPLCLHSAIRGDFRSQVRARHEGQRLPLTKGQRRSKWSHQPGTAADASVGPAAPPGHVASQPQAAALLACRERVTKLSVVSAKARWAEDETDPAGTRPPGVQTCRRAAYAPSSPLTQRDEKVHTKPQKTSSQSHRHVLGLGALHSPARSRRTRTGPSPLAHLPVIPGACSL